MLWSALTRKAGAVTLATLAANATGACGGAGPVAPPPPPPPPLGVTTIEVSGAASLAAGADVLLTAVARNAAGASLSNVPFTWESSAPGAATISTVGLLHGVAAGQVTLTARAEGKSGSLAVVVRDSSALPAMLSGKIERVDLTIAEGQTYQVTGNTALVVDSTFILAGTLVIAPGASLTLHGGKLLRITGILDGDAAAEYVIGGGAVEIGGAAPAAARLRQGSLAINGEVRNAGPIYLSAKSITVNSTGSITAGTGADGTIGDKGGRKGHNVEIGTVRARSLHVDHSGKPGGPVETLVLEDLAMIRGGDGGSGFSVLLRQDAQAQGTTLAAVAGDGGPGGDVWITADRVELRMHPRLVKNVAAGKGGRGGTVEFLGSERLQNGIGPNGEGESLLAFPGAGGGAGNIVITATQFLSTPDGVLSAPGGAPGSVYAQGGDGVNGGAGGDAYLFMATPGPPGQVTMPPGPPANDAPAPLPGVVDLFNALRGGDAASPQQPGGPGGLLQVTGPQEQPGVIAALAVSSIANGGRGFNGCAVTPVVNGTDGGPGGRRLLRLVANPLFAINEGQINFSGGNGGPGWQQAGAGGMHGQQVEGPGGAKPIGVNGAPGFNCPPLGTLRRAALANPDAGITVVQWNGTTLEATSTFPLPGAKNVERFELDPTTIVAGTGDPPAVMTIRTAADGSLSPLGFRPLPAAPSALSTVDDCIQVGQNDAVLFMSKASTANDIMSQPIVALPRRLRTSGRTVFAQTDQEVWFFKVDPATCVGDPHGAPPLPIPNLRDIAVSAQGDLFLALEQPTSGNGKLHLFSATDGIPIGGPTIITLPTRPFRVELSPTGEFAHLMGDLGTVTVVTLPDGAVRGSFALSGADEFDLVAAELQMIYTKASDPSLGQACTVYLRGDGFPAGAPVCESSSTRPRPDVDLRVLLPTPASLRAGAKSGANRRAPN